VSTGSTIRIERRRGTPTTWRSVRGLIAVTVSVALQSPWGGQALAASQIFVALEYQVLPGASGCADGEGFRDGVQRQLGYDPFRPQAERRVSVRVARSETGYDGRIQWTDARGRNVGERKLSTRRQGCTEILNNLAFAVAVQIQLLAAVAPPPPAPAASEPSSASTSSPTGSSPSAPTGSGASAPPADAPPSPETSPPPQPPAAPDAATSPPRVVVTMPPPSPRADPSSKLQLSLGLGPSLALALAPHPTATGRLFVDGRVSWFSAELSLDGALPVERQEATGAGFSFHRFATEAAACGHAAVLAACFTTGLAYLQASGTGVDAPRTPSGLAAQVGARVVATQEFGGRYFAALRAEGIVLLSRWTVTVNEISVWSTPRLAALIGVDVGARIF
jgi:hypothetical protein